MSVGFLPDFALNASLPLGGRFARLEILDYRGAARHVRSLPYGRNTDRSAWRLVREQERGTCSTKHALLAELARQIGDYKVAAHKRFVRRWAEERGLDPERVWRVREECIASLAVQ